MSRYDEKLIDTAVNWWTEKVTGFHHHDNGDRSEQSALAMMMADIMTKPVAEEQAEVFKKTLKKLVTEELDRLEDGQKSWGVELGCDYGPCVLLGQAADKAEISTLNFPFKTWMRITETDVKVHDGYGAPEKILYTSKGDLNEWTDI